MIFLSSRAENSRSCIKYTARPAGFCQPGRGLKGAVHKPSSVSLFSRDGDHLSGTYLTIRLKRPTRGNRGLRFLSAVRQVPPIRSCSRRGLPCHSGHPERGELLPHHFTLTLHLHNAGRYLFCGTFLHVTVTGYYPAPCPRSSDFPPQCHTLERPPGLLLTGELRFP